MAAVTASTGTGAAHLIRNVRLLVGDVLVVTARTASNTGEATIETVWIPNH